jgi:hypothetical protein
VANIFETIFDPAACTHTIPRNGVEKEKEREITTADGLRGLGLAGARPRYNSGFGVVS